MGDIKYSCTIGMTIFTQPFKKCLPCRSFKKSFLLVLRFHFCNIDAAVNATRKIIPAIRIMIKVQSIASPMKDVRTGSDA